MVGVQLIGVMVSSDAAYILVGVTQICKGKDHLSCMMPTGEGSLWIQVRT